jgi:hypothetical protein
LDLSSIFNILNIQTFMKTYLMVLKSTPKAAVSIFLTIEQKWLVSTLNSQHTKLIPSNDLWLVMLSVFFEQLVIKWRYNKNKELILQKNKVTFVRKRVQVSSLRHLLPSCSCSTNRENLELIFVVNTQRKALIRLLKWWTTWVTMVY